jgi:hypothetical protein
MNGVQIDFFEKVFSLLLGVMGTWVAVSSYYRKRHQETLSRYADGEKKAYAAERDFNHLRNNQEQMKEALRMLDDELRNTRDDFLEVKGILIATLNHIGTSESQIFAHRKKKEE